MFSWICKAILNTFGWKVSGEAPANKKLVIIGAPHTSNWDFPLSLLSLSALGLRFSWVGKHTLFYAPFGFFFKAIGGIPVDRTKRSAFLEKIAEEFSKREKLLLAIAPEGTRSKIDHWKAGFYYIAVQAEVEICFGFVDYGTKSVGLGPIFKPTGDIDKDFSIIAKFYTSKVGKYPNKQNDIRLREKEINFLRKEMSSSSQTMNTSPQDQNS